MMMNVEAMRRRIRIMRRIENKIMLTQAVAAATTTLTATMAAMETIQNEVVLIQAAIITMISVMMVTMKINASPRQLNAKDKLIASAVITDIVDGDTLDVNNVRIRLSLVNTPEIGDSGYTEAKEFTESKCPIGSEALVDEDDGQKEGSFDRLIGLVYCGNEKLLLNDHLLDEGHAQIFEDFCGRSEFSEEAWVKEFGC